MDSEADAVDHVGRDALLLSRAVAAHEAKHGRRAWEMSEVLRAVGECSPIKTIVEVGTFQGDSLRIWRAAFDPEMLIGVQDTQETSDEVAREVGARMVIGKSQWVDTFQLVLKILDGRSVDFLYLDGDHTYDAVLRDWELYGSLVRPGGVIALHDAVIEDNETVDVFRLYRELRDRYRTMLLYDGPSQTTGCALVFVP